MRIRSDSACIIESPPDDSNRNGWMPEMSRPSGPRFGARTTSRFAPFVPVYPAPMLIVRAMSC